MENQPSTDGEKGWSQILTLALNLPFVKVDRTAFLRNELSRYCSNEEIHIAIEQSPLKVLSKKQIDKIANGCIKYHTTLVCGASAVAGLLGGFAMAATIPADIVQYYGHVLTLIQKLLYLYGYPEISNEKGEIDDETANIFTIFMGVMLGCKVANDAAKELAKAVAKGVSKNILNMAVKKSATFQLMKQIGKWIGVNLTKKTASNWAGKFIPLIGAPISGAITYFSFNPMAELLKKHLDEQYEILAI